MFAQVVPMMTMVESMANYGLCACYFHDDNGGVSTYERANTWGSNLLPLKASSEAIDSSSAISAIESLTDKAPMFSSKFSNLEVPGMGLMSSPWCRTHANASWDGVHPFFCAISWIRLNKIVLCSRLSSCNLGLYYSSKIQNQNK